MAKKLPEISTGTDRIYRRMIASKAFLSGELEALRLAATAQGAPQWRILRYPHICNPEKLAYPIPTANYVRPEAFESHLKYLSTDCSVISLPKLVELIKSGEPIPERAAVITLDCGYLDHFEIAAPLLKKYGLTATFFLPAAFIGTSNFFWQDKITVSMLIYKNLNLPIPPLSFLDENFYKEMRAIAPNGEVTPESIALLIRALERATPEERLIAIHIIGHSIATGNDLPKQPCFMDWNHARELEKTGFTIGSLGDANLYADEMPITAIVDDLEKSKTTFKTAEVSAEILAFPEGRFSAAAVTEALRQGFQTQCLLGALPPPRYAPNQPILLGRVPMYQDASFCVELFACRMYELVISGIAF